MLLVGAAPTKGSALAGTTKTFDAKTGTQLNDGYQSGYFPTTSSHSLNIDIEGGNEFTFVYVPKAEVNYTVRYLEKDTNVVLHEEKHAATRDAVITEKFVQITGYAPDAYQKRLVLSADDENNVITFWYVKDDAHAPVHTVGKAIVTYPTEGSTASIRISEPTGVINLTAKYDAAAGELSIRAAGNFQQFLQGFCRNNNADIAGAFHFTLDNGQTVAVLLHRG